ncbi:hypothetical protein BIT18_1796, partial [Mycobacterium tuberculosis variant bovis]
APKAMSRTTAVINAPAPKPALPDVSRRMGRLFTTEFYPRSSRSKCR